ncbi:MAG: O-acetyl-ADP-ribose deacetylase [Leptospirales bacterium]
MVSLFHDRVFIRTGDITKESLDVIVNAANGSLMGGGGVDGAIHRAGGPAILEECKKIRQTELPDGLPDGEVVITTAGNLPCKNVIHTVGPRWAGGNSGEPEKLADCYRNSLMLAKKKGLKSIGFPAISTGVFGYPPDLAAVVSSTVVRDFLADNDIPHVVNFIFFGTLDMETFLEHCVLV